MKKLFFGLTLLIVLLLGGIYALLFTPVGNSLVASLIENKVNEGQKDVNMKVNDFKLTMNEILLKASLDENSTINIQGALNLFAKSVDLKYDINIKDLSKLQNITKQKLNGSFATNGIIKGNQKQALIKGESLIASGKTTYDVTLQDFKPSSILFSMNGAKIEELLYLVNQAKYASGILNIDANIKNADISNLDGTVVSKVSNGLLNAKAFNKDLKINPETPISFDLNTNSILQGSMINTNVDLNSVIANLDVEKANVNLKTNVINSDYKLFVKDLSKLEAIINQKFNGSFTTIGNVSIDNGVIKVDGDTDILASNTNYNAKIVNSKPEFINLTVTRAKIKELLDLLNQPTYASGLININAQIKNADINNLDGKVLTTILEGKVNNKIVNKQFEQKLEKPISFKGEINTELKDTKAISTVDLDTTLSNLDLKKAVYDIEKGEFLSDYTLDVNDLSKLYDISQMKMRGSAKVIGNIKQNKESLSIDGASELFGGKINFDLLNDDFTAKIDGVEIKDLTHMLYYPEIFTSKSNIDIAYNLASKEGNIGGNLLNGQFIKNEYSNIINTLANFDLTKEIYEKVEIKSDIKEEIIKTIVDMKSEHTTIKVPNSILNSKEKTIEALVKAEILKYSFDTNISGNLSNPKVKVDTKAFLNNTKVGKKIKKKTEEVKKKIEKNLKKKLGEDFKLDKLFNKAPSKKTTTKTAINDVKKPTNAEIAAAFKEFFAE